MPSAHKNRWLIAASAVGIHISIGSVYAYSAWKMPLENTFGWKPTQTSLAFSVAIFCLGLSAAFLGRVIERKGPRFGGLLSSGFFAAGLLGSGLACQLESLVLFYFFFGVVSGIGLGLGYIAPVSTLVKWFPDRRGLATGLAIMGFGFGGLICAQLIDLLVAKTDEAVLPIDASAYVSRGAPPVGMPDIATFKEQRAAYDRSIRSGQTDTPEFAALESALRVDARGRLGLKGVVYYEKGQIVTGFLVLAGIYFAVMTPSAWYISPPPPGYAEAFAQQRGRPVRSPARELTAKQALRTPAFYGLWVMLFLNVACGIAVIATAKKMGYEMVRLPVEMASVLVMGISLFNGLGRIFWASLSDVIGRPNTYIAFFAIQVVAFPALANLTAYPIAFMAVTFVILTCYGGGFASIPAYISDLFGLEEMPTIHGFVLTSWSLAGLVGPMINAAVYEQTHDYRLSLYIFGGAFVVALVVSILMKGALRRVERAREGLPAST